MAVSLDRARHFRCKHYSFISTPLTNRKHPAKEQISRPFTFPPNHRREDSSAATANSAVCDITPCGQHHKPFRLKQSRSEPCRIIQNEGKFCFYVFTGCVFGVWMWGKRCTRCGDCDCWFFWRVVCVLMVGSVWIFGVYLESQHGVCALGLDHRRGVICEWGAGRENGAFCGGIWLRFDCCWVDGRLCQFFFRLGAREVSMRSSLCNEKLPGSYFWYCNRGVEMRLCSLFVVVLFVSLPSMFGIRYFVSLLLPVHHFGGHDIRPKDVHQKTLILGACH